MQISREACLSPAQTPFLARILTGMPLISSTPFPKIPGLGDTVNRRVSLSLAQSLKGINAYSIPSHYASLAKKPISDPIITTVALNAGTSCTQYLRSSINNPTSPRHPSPLLVVDSSSPPLLFTARLTLTFLLLPSLLILCLRLNCLVGA